MALPFFLKHTKLFCFVPDTRTTIFSDIAGKFFRSRASFIYNIIVPFLHGNKVLDIGMGSGSLTCWLLRHGYQAQGIDVRNLSIYCDIQPILYNGIQIPFPDRAFDNALLIHVLHHTNNPAAILREAKRVSKRVICVEDTYRTKIEWLLVALNDMVGNFEFSAHKYKTQREWKQVITEHRWKLVCCKEWSRLFPPGGFGYGRYIIFVIE
jgi:ubiquinone/menaquinone biosynthesis C-methylase UbiE